MKPWALGVLFFAALPAWAQMYKCVDERGVTHYSDNPRAGCKGVKVDIQGSPLISRESAPSQSSREAVAPKQGGGVPQRDAEFRNRQAERERADAQEKAALAERCGNLREEYARLASGIPLAKINSKGEREYLDDATRDVRLAQVKGEMRGCP